MGPDFWSKVNMGVNNERINWWVLFLLEDECIIHSFVWWIMLPKIDRDFGIQIYIRSIRAETVIFYCFTESAHLHFLPRVPLVLPLLFIFESEKKQLEYWTTKIFGPFRILALSPSVLWTRSFTSSSLNTTTDKTFYFAWYESFVWIAQIAGQA